MEARNRFKGRDLIDRVPDELWTEVRDIVQETGIKNIPEKKKCKKAKWLSEEALQIAVRRREVKNQGGFVGPTKELGMCIMAREIKTQMWTKSLLGHLQNHRDPSAKCLNTGPVMSCQGCSRRGSVFRTKFSSSASPDLQHLGWCIIIHTFIYTHLVFKDEHEHLKPSKGAQRDSRVWIFSQNQLYFTLVP